MTFEEMNAAALELRADLSASADDMPELNPDSLKERNAAAALSVLSDVPPAGGHVRALADMTARAETIYHAAVAEAESRRASIAGGAAMVVDADLDGYLYMAAHEPLTVAHAANAAWAELTLVAA